MGDAGAPGDGPPHMGTQQPAGFREGGGPTDARANSCQRAAVAHPCPAGQPVERRPRWGEDAVDAECAKRFERRGPAYAGFDITVYCWSVGRGVDATTSGPRGDVIGFLSRVERGFGCGRAGGSVRPSGAAAGVDRIGECGPAWGVVFGPALCVVGGGRAAGSVSTGTYGSFAGAGHSGRWVGCARSADGAAAPVRV